MRKELSDRGYIAKLKYRLQAESLQVCHGLNPNLP